MSDAGRLYVCAVPIGNLGDASTRLVETFKHVHAIACEDTRSTKRLLELLGVDEIPRLLAHHAHNERVGASGVVALLEQGHDIALVSDAGTPAVSDPGVALVAAAHEAGIDVVSVPGPSAVAAALSIAGLGDGSGHRFVGFLPRSASEVGGLASSSRAELIVAFESPQRLRSSLAALRDVHPERLVAVVREATKRHEEVVRGALDDVFTHFDGAAQIRGECVVVLAPCSNDERDRAEVDQRDVEAALELVEGGCRAKVACRVLASRSGGSSRALYDAVVAARAAADTGG